MDPQEQQQIEMMRLPTKSSCDLRLLVTCHTATNREKWLIKYSSVHCFETLPQKSALSGRQSAPVDFETRIATN